MNAIVVDSHDTLIPSLLALHGVQYRLDDESIPRAGEPRFTGLAVREDVPLELSTLANQLVRIPSSIFTEANFGFDEYPRRVAALESAVTDSVSSLLARLPGEEFFA